MQRNYSIDTLRTIATMLVVILHTSANYIINSTVETNILSTFWVSNIIDSFTRISVPLFVLISGMFVLGRRETFQQSYSRAINRILRPLIFWTIFYVLFNILFIKISGDTLNIKEIFFSVINGSPFYHLWYLYMVIGLYLAIPIINKCIAGINKKTLWIIAFTLLTLGMINSIYNSYFHNQVFFIFWFINYLGYFLLGYLIKDYEKKFSIKILSFTYIFSSISIAILSYFTMKYFGNLYFYGYLTPFVIIGAISIFKLFQQLNIKENFLSKISFYTFGIYLIHPALLHIIDFLIKKHNINFFSNPLMGIPVKFAITFVFSLILAKAISNIKLLNKII